LIETGCPTLKVFKGKKRQRLRSQPFPAEWDATLRENFPLYRRLPAADRRELQGNIHVFLDEKCFEGCGGLEMTDEIRVTIAAQACLLLLHRDTNFFPAMTSVFVYPSLFYADVVEENEDGTVSEFEEDRSGESWDYGPVVLSWEDALAGASGEEGGYNSVIHEFAHQLDLENGAADGVPKLESGDQYDSWERVFGEAYARFERIVNLGQQTVIDEYGVEGPDEFFAVATEHFFNTPAELRSEYPELYDKLKSYYRQDPDGWPQTED
jgi:Mlc titration factor MtfA (ptsG expression regulator)